MRNSRLHVFVGPTRWGLGDAMVSDTDVVWLPPVRRGDVSRLVGSQSPGQMAIVDGQFHHAPAVGHAELLEAMVSGWEVWGLSSMGAIRAAEMHELGLHGFGKVFEAFLSDTGMRDDEVTMLHEPEPPYRSVSEPLIHLRRAARWLLQTGNIEMVEAIIRPLEGMWFGARTWQAWSDLAIGAGAPAYVVEDACGRVASFRTKSHDLQAFLREKPWSR